MDGGIGEAALLDAMLTGAGTGAAVNGGMALLSGKDPLQAALMGGLMGGATGGLMNGFMPGASAAGAAATESAPAAFAGPSLAEQLGTAAAPEAAAGMSSSLPSVTGGVGGSFSDAGFAAANPQMGLTEAANTNLGGVGNSANNMLGGAKDWWSGLSNNQKLLTGGAGLMGASMLADRNKYGIPQKAPYTGPLSKFHYDPANYRPSLYAEGGITSLNQGGNMSVGGGMNSLPPISEDNNSSYDWQSRSFPDQMMAHGGITSLGSYSDGGHMLKGPGDGMSDSIPASIAGHRPARLATDEFVVPADVVSHLGNGSSDAGAKQLYAMMDRVRQARTGSTKQGHEIHPTKYMPS